MTISGLPAWYIEGILHQKMKDVCWVYIYDPSTPRWHILIFRYPSPMKNCHFTSNKWLYQEYPLDISRVSHVRRWKMSIECIFMIPQLHVGTFGFFDTALPCKTVILPSNPLQMRQYEKYPLDILMVSHAQRWKMSIECIFMNPELHVGTFLFLDTPLPWKTVILPPTSDYIRNTHLIYWWVPTSKDERCPLSVYLWSLNSTSAHFYF
jgi:hypothetical protein